MTFNERFDREYDRASMLARELDRLGPLALEVFRRWLDRTDPHALSEAQWDGLRVLCALNEGRSGARRFRITNVTSYAGAHPPHTILVYMEPEDSAANMVTMAFVPGRAGPGGSPYGEADLRLLIGAARQSSNAFNLFAPLDVLREALVGKWIRLKIQRHAYYPVGARRNEPVMRDKLRIFADDWRLFRAGGFEWPREAPNEYQAPSPLARLFNNRPEEPDV